MFPNSYFAESYFAPRYFPPISVIIVVVGKGTGGRKLRIERYLVNDDEDLIDLIIIIVTSGLLDE